MSKLANDLVEQYIDAAKNNLHPESQKSSIENRPTNDDDYYDENMPTNSIKKILRKNSETDTMTETDREIFSEGKTNINSAIRLTNETPEPTNIDEQNFGDFQNDPKAQVSDNSTDDLKDDPEVEPYLGRNLLPRNFNLNANPIGVEIDTKTQNKSIWASDLLDDPELEREIEENTNSNSEQDSRKNPDLNSQDAKIDARPENNVKTLRFNDKSAKILHVPPENCEKSAEHFLEVKYGRDFALESPKSENDSHQSSSSSGSCKSRYD